jgi:alkylhydroperoxidase family enzyme
VIEGPITEALNFGHDRTGVWQQQSHHLDRRQLIEFCLLAGQYDCLAATMSALEIPLDNPGAHK